MNSSITSSRICLCTGILATTLSGLASTSFAAPALEAYLKASNTAPLHRFGWSVAIDGDTAVVGSRDEGSASQGINGSQTSVFGNGTGAVYVFVRENGAWSQQAYIKASDSATGLNFGTSVAIDGNRLVAGAKGKAYVFSRTGTAWVQEDILYGQNGGGSLGKGFGASVDIEGDRVIVGDPNDASAQGGINGDGDLNQDARGAGAASVFVRLEEGIWVREAYLKAASPDGIPGNPDGRGDAFGISVSLSENTAAVGANGEAGGSSGINGDQTDNSAPGSGAVFIFTREGETWTPQAYLKTSNAGQNALFGQSVALDGDRLLAGAPGEAGEGKGVNADPAGNSAAGSGAAYLFTRTAGTWTQDTYFKASNAEAGDGFGHAVALDGSLAAVSAWYEDSPAAGVGGDQGNDTSPGNLAHYGAVYVFGKGSGPWAQTSYVKASTPGAYDEFGGNFIGLSGTTLIAGAQKEDDSAKGINSPAARNNSSTESGAAYIFSGFETGLAVPLAISSCSMENGKFVIVFTASPGLAGWQIQGSADLSGFPDDHTANTVVTETAPGIYRASVTPPAAQAGRYFFRIAR